MPTLRQAARARGAAGERLPDVFPALAEQQAHLRRGHMHLIASAPGVGKSVFSIVQAVNLQVPTLYLAMDGDETTTCIRVIQSFQSCDQQTAEEQLKSDGLLARQVLDTVSWVRFDFPNSPDMDEIIHRTWAFAEINGEFPHLIVVDNLMDVVDEYSAGAYSDAERDLCSLARATNAAVLVLAHVTGAHEGAAGVVPLSGLMFKPSKKPSLIMTMYPGSEGTVWMSVLKNRFGPADTSGLGVRARLEVDYSRMQAW